MAQATTITKELKRRICHILNLDPKQVRNIHLHLTVDDAILAEVDRYVYDNELEQLIMELQEFELLPRSKPLKIDDQST
jgi:Fe-S-cluster formation regulator IscX/YfhJ